MAEASSLALKIAMLYLMSRYPSLTLSQCGQRCHCGTSILNCLLAALVEHGSVVWDPHTIKEKNKVERVHRRAARMVSNDYEQLLFTAKHQCVIGIVLHLAFQTMHDNVKIGKLCRLTVRHLLAVDKNCQ